MEPVRPSPAEAPSAAVFPALELAQNHQQNASRSMREELQARYHAKMKRVTEWVAHCAAARQIEGEGTFLGCDGETEDLLLQVLIARPKYQGIPTVEEIQQFAGQLNAYNARLWTLGMTKGFFRAGSAAGDLGWLPEYPDDIDSLESLSMQEDEGVNWRVHEKRVFVRKISPAEEELRDEMIQEYRNIRRHSLNGNGTMNRRRTISVSAREFSGKLNGFTLASTGSNKENQMPGMVC